MLDYLFIKGCLIGFFIALPVGPIGMLCIQHSLVRGMACGLVAGLGAALADTLYGALAASGIALVSRLLENHQIWLQLIGAIFLFYLGIKTLKMAPANEKESKAPRGLTHVFITTFFLTLTNPMTFLGFTGLYAGLGIGLQEESLVSSSLLIGGVFIGSSAWWLLLSCGSSKIGKKMSDKSARFLQKASGIVILSSGGLTSLAIIQQFLGFFA